MKSKSLRLLPVILAAVMIMSVFAVVPVGAAETSDEPVGETYTGTTGDCTWRLDDDGTLTIKGEGAMADYEADNVPWMMNRENIKTAVIGDGVTHIGDYSFFGCKSTKVVISDSVETIGEYAFYRNPDLTDLTLGNNVKTIGDCAFVNCGLTSVTIPGTVTELGRISFGYNYDYDDELGWLTTKVEGFTIKGCTGTIAEEYADIHDFTFIPLTASSALIGDVNGDDTVDILDAAMIQKYTVEKITLTDEQLYAADVNNDGVVDILDAIMIQKYTVEKIQEFPKKG